MIIGREMAEICHGWGVPYIAFFKVVYQIGIFRSVSVGISRYYQYQYQRISRSVIFGIKTLAGAPQKIGGSPLFPKKGGPRPPFCTLRPPFEEKKEFSWIFSKKEFPRILKKVFPPKLNVQQSIPTEIPKAQQIWKTQDWGGKGGKGGGNEGCQKWFWRDSIFSCDRQ